MSQITLHLDGATQALVDQADTIRMPSAHEWPQECLALAGRFPDFPLCEGNGNGAQATEVQGQGV